MTGMATLLGEEPTTILPALRSFRPVGKTYVQPDFGLQITGGSTSISSNWIRLREAGAAGRALFVAAASEVWQVEGGQVRTANGVCFCKGLISKSRMQIWLHWATHSPLRHRH